MAPHRITKHDNINTPNINGFRLAGNLFLVLLFRNKQYKLSTKTNKADTIVEKPGLIISPPKKAIEAIVRYRLSVHHS